jgi:hypothetical protein
MNEPEEGTDILPMNEARGLGWIVIPALIGLVIGTMIALVRNPAWIDVDVLKDGALVGAALGAAAGAFFWAFFPYKSKAPSPKDEAPVP